MYLLIIPLVLFLILFIVYKKKYSDIEYKKWVNIQELTQRERDKIRQSCEAEQRQYRKLTSEVAELQRTYNALKETQQESIDKDLNFYRETKLQEINNQRLTKEREASEEFDKFIAMINANKAVARIELDDIKEELEDFRRRREVINEQVLREKALQDEENFYKVCLSDDDIDDLSIIKEIEHRFNNKMVLYRAAFDCYIKKPAQEMIKRVLNGRDPSGIYCITYRPTGEIYIGRSTHVGKRWMEHIKNAAKVGNQIAHTSLHTKMERDGIWNFGFQLLEEVEKEKLGEREKFYIDLYGSKMLLNEKSGG